MSLQCVLDFFKDNKDAILAFGVFLASFTSVFGVLWSARATRRSAIGQLRAKWIEDLRNEISCMLILRTALAVETNSEVQRKILDSVEDFRILYGHLSKIEMSLNRSEALHLALHEACFAYVHADDAEDMNPLREDVYQAFAAVSKAEWIKAKKGTL